MVLVGALNRNDVRRGSFYISLRFRYFLCCCCCSFFLFFLWKILERQLPGKIWRRWWLWAVAYVHTTAHLHTPLRERERRVPEEGSEEEDASSERRRGEGDAEQTSRKWWWRGGERLDGSRNDEPHPQRTPCSYTLKLARLNSTRERESSSSLLHVIFLRTESAGRPSLLFSLEMFVVRWYHHRWKDGRTGGRTDGWKISSFSQCDRFLTVLYNIFRPSDRNKPLHLSSSFFLSTYCCCCCFLNSPSPCSSLQHTAHCPDCAINTIDTGRRWQMCARTRERDYLVDCYALPFIVVCICARHCANASAMCRRVRGYNTLV